MQESDFLYLGQCVRDARKRCGLTQQELADRSGMGLRHIQNIEYGLVNPSYECLNALVKSLGVSANLLFHPNMSEQDVEPSLYEGGTPDFTPYSEIYGRSVFRTPCGTTYI